MIGSLIVMYTIFVPVVQTGVPMVLVNLQCQCQPAFKTLSESYSLLLCDFQICVQVVLVLQDQGLEDLCRVWQI